MPNSLPVERSFFSTSQLGAADSFDAWQDSISILFDVAPTDMTLADGFIAEVESYLVGTMMLAKSRSKVQAFQRDKQTIARTGMDHILIQIYNRGGNDILGQEGIVRTRPGDIQIIDMAQEMSTRTHAANSACQRECTTHEFINTSIFIGREKLETLFPALHKLHLAIIPANTALNTILRTYLLSLYDNADSLNAMEAQSLEAPTLELLAATLGQSPETVEYAKASIENALLMVIRRFIDRNLHEQTLNPDCIAAAAGISRASLFRICEPLGGVMAFVRERRLMVAKRKLTKAKAATSIKSLAYSLGFSSPGSFTRTFKTRFGCTPSEMDGLSIRGGHTAAEDPSLLGTALDRRYEHWMANIVG